MNRPDRDVVGGAIQPALALAQLNQLAQRAMDAYCEVLRPGKAGGFGKAGEAPYFSGRLRCSIEQVSRGTETGGTDGVSSVLEYAFMMPRSVRISPEFRIAVPAFFTDWRPDQQYAVGAIVKPVGLESGNGPYFRCAMAGQSGSNQPDWPIKRSALVEDGDAIWRCDGYIAFYEVTAIYLPQSQANKVIALCRELN